MTPRMWIELGLILSLIVVSALAYGYRADAKSTRAQLAPLHTAVSNAAKIIDAHREAQKRCVDEMGRVRDDNQRALAAAEAKRQAAERDAEAFRRRLAQPLPRECDAILTAKVCPALMDY